LRGLPRTSAVLIIIASRLTAYLRWARQSACCEERSLQRPCPF
jgi:hypothetical protein